MLLAATSHCRELRIAAMQTLPTVVGTAIDITLLGLVLRIPHACFSATFCASNLRILRHPLKSSIGTGPLQAKSKIPNPKP